MTDHRDDAPMEREPGQSVDPAAKTQPAEGGRDEVEEGLDDDRAPSSGSDTAGQDEPS